MKKPETNKLEDFHQYFAIQCNNRFWSLSETELGDEEKLQALGIAHTSLFHWRETGTAENVQLANLAVARAYCINESPHSLIFATEAFDFFDGSGEIWVQAFTNAVLSHALQIAGSQVEAEQKYENAVRMQAELSEGDRRVFDATFKLIPKPGK